MTSTKQEVALVSDFDGTITDDDFFTYAVDAYLNDDAMAPWREYRAGRKSHFNALNEIFAKIRVDEDILRKLIATIKIDEHAEKVWRICNEKNIPLYICSAGNDYYIKQLMGKEIEKYGIAVITNKGTYNREIGLSMQALPTDSPFYDKDVGISKAKVVKKLKEDGYTVIFAGDGPPDIAPAKIADVVFARKILLQECEAAGIKTELFDSFDNIYNYIKEL